MQSLRNPTTIDAQWHEIGEPDSNLFRRVQCPSELRPIFALEDRPAPSWLAQDAYRIELVYPHRSWRRRARAWARCRLGDALAGAGIALLCVLFAALATLAILVAGR